MTNQTIGYRVGKWNDLPNFECTGCDYANLEEDKTQMHLIDVHGVLAEAPIAGRPAGRPSAPPMQSASDA